MNLLLLQEGYPFAIIKNENRLAYINAIENTRVTENYTNFYELILKAVKESLDNYLEAIAESEML
jgi:hypothetical protein